VRARVTSKEFVDVLVAVRQASQEHPEGFCTDDIWPLLGFVPTERNIIGAAFQEAHARGWITGTERFVKSRRKEAKGRRVQMWVRA
jgi:hypothetical protein